MGTTSIALHAPMTTVGRCAPVAPDAAEGFRLIDRGNDYVVEVQGTLDRVRQIADHAARAVGLYTNRRPGVRLFLELSTAHLPPALRDFHRLNQYAAVVAYEMDDGDYGRYHAVELWVPDDPRETASVYDDDDQPPAEVLALQLYARELGCDYIRFDRDADCVPGLATFQEA